MRANELAPRRGLFSLRRRREVVPLQDIADRLITHPIAHILQCTHNSIVSPRTIVFGELDDQLFNFFIESWSARIPPVLRSVELLRDKFPVPGENSLRLTNGGNAL